MVRRNSGTIAYAIAGVKRDGVTDSARTHLGAISHAGHRVLQFSQLFHKPALFLLMAREVRLKQRPGIDLGSAGFTFDRRQDLVPYQNRLRSVLQSCVHV